MGNNAELIRDIEELQDLKRMRDELDLAIEAASDKVKADMGDTETALAGPYKVIYRTVLSTRVDTTALKKEQPEIAARYSNTSESRPLRITAS